MKSGDKLIQAIKRRNILRQLWEISNTKHYTGDWLYWTEYLEANKN